MNLHFTAVTDTATLPYKEAQIRAAEEALEKKLPAVRFQHQNISSPGISETRLVNLNVEKRIRSNDKRIHCVALPGSNVFVLKN
jgi:hypothetical protein